jgi:hypothetical protein
LHEEAEAMYTQGIKIMVNLLPIHPTKNRDTVATVAKYGNWKKRLRDTESVIYGLFESI